ncbi:sucrose phosphorylase [Gynuella sp.]|uniref:sucrose phosphorylase n=1 Tax=Gynuella sp. TaxID=2969146 RepID=UPI003D09BF94
MKNQVQLITYIDRLGKGDIRTLERILSGPLKGLFGGIHMLPFFTPFDGADAGFDPSNHAQVDPRLGDWQDIKRLSGQADLMADLIVNHVSSESPQFQDVLAKGEQSKFNKLFLTMNSVFPDGVTEQQICSIYRPRPNLPWSMIKLADGSTRLFWTTFTAQQIDIDVESEQGQQYLLNILDEFHQAGISTIRLDAAGYAIKRPDTSCFMIPETFDFIAQLTEQARARNIEVLVEIHSYYQTQIEIAAKVDRVYDFALPPLILHTLFNKDAAPLMQWFNVSPRNCITVLDTHDGIGVIDVGADNGRPGLLAPQQIDDLVEQIHRHSNSESRLATGAAASNLDLYQVNCSFYDALGKNDQLYLIARAIQFFAPGIPQVYYQGLLAGKNDMELLATTKVGRDINRRYFSEQDIEAHIQQPVVQKLFELIRIRNEAPEFNGVFSFESTANHEFVLSWQLEDSTISLAVDLNQNQAIIFTVKNAKPSRDIWKI